MTLQSETGAPPIPNMSVALMPYQGDSNPYIRLLAGSLEERGVQVNLVRGLRLRELCDSPKPVDVVHLQWQHRLFVSKSGGILKAIRTSLSSFRQLRRLQSAGVTLIWTVHNVVNHERKFAAWELGAVAVSPEESTP